MLSGWVDGWVWWVRERERWPQAKVDGTATPTLACWPAQQPTPSLRQTKPGESADALQQQPHHLLIVVDRVGVLGRSLPEWN